MLQDALFFSAASHGTYSIGSTEVTVPRTKPIMSCVYFLIPNADSCNSEPIIITAELSLNSI